MRIKHSLPNGSLISLKPRAENGSLSSALRIDLFRHDPRIDDQSTGGLSSGLGR